MNRLLVAAVLAAAAVACSPEPEQLVAIHSALTIDVTGNGFSPVVSPSSFLPYDQAAPPCCFAAYAPLPPPPYWAAWYPNIAVYPAGTPHLPLYVSECTPNGPNGTPRGSVDVTLGDNTWYSASGNGDGVCARITPPTHDGTAYIWDWRQVMANGWRSNHNGSDVSIRSVEVGPNTAIVASSNYRVDASPNLQCLYPRTGGRCQLIDNGGNSSYSLEADHFYAAGGTFALGGTLEAGWRANSITVLSTY